MSCLDSKIRINWPGFELCGLFNQKTTNNLILFSDYAKLAYVTIDLGQINFPNLLNSFVKCFLVCCQNCFANTPGL